jgi:hypothetical protein
MLDVLEIDGWGSTDGLESGDGWGFGTEHHGEFEGGGYGCGGGLNKSSNEVVSDGFGYNHYHTIIDSFTDKVLDGDGNGRGIFAQPSDW